VAGAVFLTAWAALTVSVVSALALAGYFLVFVGVLYRLLAYQKRVAESAALEERRRLARDYHDGLAQELAFLSPRLAAAARLNRELEPLRQSAERAMQECRLAIAALSMNGEDDLSAAVVETSETIAAREGARLTLDVNPGVRAGQELRETFLRVASEAVTNAARHGHAQTVRVELEGGDATILRVRDDGCGFDPAHPAGSGFGLISMHERVHALGGELRVESVPGDGTLVEVRIP